MSVWLVCVCLVCVCLVCVCVWCVCVLQTPVEVFEEVLLGALKSDLSSAFSTPEQLQLLLVALQRFPQVLKPKKLHKLLGTSTIVTPDNIPKWVTSSCSYNE